jgi:hypothetical protein
VSNNIAEGSERGTTNELLAFICIARGCAGKARSILGDSSHVIDTARKSAARSVNRIMTAAYWLIGRRIVESEQKGDVRAGYGEELPKRLSTDIGKCHAFVFQSNPFGELFWERSGWERRDDLHLYSRTLQPK